MSADARPNVTIAVALVLVVAATGWLRAQPRLRSAVSPLPASAPDDPSTATRNRMLAPSRPAVDDPDGECAEVIPDDMADDAADAGDAGIEPEMDESAADSGLCSTVSATSATSSILFVALLAWIVRRRPRAGGR